MSARRKRSHEEEEHENHERWLITYADMITLLMAFFIMLFTMSQLDLAKFKEFQQGFASQVSNKKIDLIATGGAGVLDGSAGTQEELLKQAEQVLNAQAKEDLERQLERDRLLDVEKEFVQRVRAAGLARKVGFRLEHRGLIVSIVSDDVLFDVGSAELRGEGQKVLDGLAGVLRDMPNHVAVEGHTDNVPISGGQYRDNWVLSTARATSVLSYLLGDHGIAASRLSAAGYADQRPVSTNSTDAGRATNRRVEIVILSSMDPKEDMKLKRAGTDATPTDGDVVASKRSTGNLIPAVVLAVGMVAGGFFFNQGGAAPAPAPPPESHAKTEEVATHGPVQNLEPITLNLNDGHFLKVGLALQLHEAEGGHGAAEELPSAKALDIAITLLGSYSMDQLADPKVRELVKKKLSEQVAAAYVDPVTSDSLVTTVYFTEFVMQ